MLCCLIIKELNRFFLVTVANRQQSAVDRNLVAFDKVDFPFGHDEGFVNTDEIGSRQLGFQVFERV